MAATLARAGAPLKVGSGNERACRVTARRAVMLCLLRAGAGLVAGSPWQSRAQGGVDTRRTEDSDVGLARLEAVLERQLGRRKGALPLPWRESILTPATARLVWHARSLSVRLGGDVFRVALDPVTRWYFVAQVPQGSVRPRFFGPIEETIEGSFVEAFAAAPTPSAPPGRKRARP